jgi:sugar phosphate isomerase/epimerase
LTNGTGLQISLAAWSMHRLFEAKEIDQVGMLRLCAEFGIGGFELVNRFFPAPQYTYLRRFRQTADELGVRLVLIMCDGEGEMASADPAERAQAVKNHHKWIDVAQVLGCHSIRVNCYGDQSDPDMMRERAVESFSRLLDYAATNETNVIIENHHGRSSDPDWLVPLMKAVGHPRFGTLPDFGNWPAEVDRYEAVRKLMPFAKAVSAKCYDFDDAGDDTKIDFARMIGIVREAGYSGFVGIEYEGQGLAEREGIAAAKRLLERYV